MEKPTALTRAVAAARLLAAVAAAQGRRADAAELLGLVTLALDEDEAGEGDPDDIARDLTEAIARRRARS